MRIRGRHSQRFYSFADKLLRTEVELEKRRRQVDTDASTVEELEGKVAGFRTSLLAAATEIEV